MPVHLDQLLDEIGAGPHQWLHIFISCLILILAGANLYSFIFLVAAPDFRCLVPALDNVTSRQPQYSDLSPAQLESWHPCTVDADGTRRFDNCYRYTEPHSELKNCSVGNLVEGQSQNHSLNIVKCTQWIYDRSVYHETGVTDFDLVCDRRVEQAVVQDMYQIGLILGCVLSGYLSDRIGRRRACLIFLTLHAVIGVGNIFVGGSIVVFDLFRVCCGFTSGALSNIPLVYALELVRHSHRKLVNFLLLISMTTGAVTTGFVAWALHGAWRPLQLVLGAPAVLPLFLLLSFGSESFRWLLSRKRYEEAEREIRLTCKRNRVTNKDEILRQILSRAEQEQQNESRAADNKSSASVMMEPSQSRNILDDAHEPHEERTPRTPSSTVMSMQSSSNLAQSTASSRKNSKSSGNLPATFYNDQWISLWTWPQMRAKLLILLFCWLCVSLVLTGLQVNSVNLPGLNAYANFIIISAMEFPGNFLALITVDRVGRRKSVAMFFILTGILNAMAGFVPHYWHTALLLVPTFLAKLTSTATWNAANIFAAELFPTTVRTSGLGLCFLAADVGGIVAPFVTLLSVQTASVTRFIPPLIFCIASVAGGVLCTLLPETLDAELAQTIAQAEQLRVGMPCHTSTQRRKTATISDSGRTATGGRTLAKPVSAGGTAHYSNTGYSEEPGYQQQTL